MGAGFAAPRRAVKPLSGRVGAEPEGPAGIGEADRAAGTASA
jgi:hypothetical protein